MGMLDSGYKERAPAGYLGQTVWHDHRTYIPAGFVAADGVLLSRDNPLYKLVAAGRVPVCTEVEWWANPKKRGCYTTGTDGTNFRIPDRNGVQSGSYLAPVLRGDGGAAEFPGAMQNSPVYGRDSTNEIQMNSAVGCYIICFAGKVENENLLDALTLATRIEQVNTDLATFKAACGKWLSYTDPRITKYLQFEGTQGDLEILCNLGPNSIEARGIVRKTTLNFSSEANRALAHVIAQLPGTTGWTCAYAPAVLPGVKLAYTERGPSNNISFVPSDTATYAWIMFNIVICFN